MSERFHTKHQSSVETIYLEMYTMSVFVLMQTSKSNTRCSVLQNMLN